MTRSAGAVFAGPRDWADPGDLRSTTVELAPDADVDPFALAGGAGGLGPGVVMASRQLVLAGHGVAARLDLGRGIAGAVDGAVRRWLAAVPGGGAVAFGALPFSPGEATALVVPTLLYGRSATRQWVTVVAAATAAPDDPTAGLAAATRRREAGAGPAPRCTDVSGSPDAVFTGGVSHILDAIAAGRVTKVVLARQLVADYDAPLDVVAVLRRLRDLEPAATVYGLIEPDGAFVGASPELLVARHGSSV